MSTRVRAALMVCLAAATTGLAACGQKGALYLPTDPAAAQRATLPQLLTPGGSDSTSSTNTTPAPAAPASSATTNSTNDSTGTRK
ncbi:LPS translocon maturation chaperone LptM [Variovorax paradoxus]|uniref:LPS translocon maturation chaperone LptM n=1 Tax=Variovorax paradoxus TaxID=34073 RepID=UPI003C6F438D